MGFAQILRLKHRFSFKCAAALAAIVVVALPGRAQTTKPAQKPDMPWDEDLRRYPGLLPEFGKLVEKLQQNIQYPPARSESRLSPLLPESTISYAAFSNYGETAQQALKIFRQELEESSVLRDWWQHGELAAAGPKFEESLEKFSQFHQYLGEEIVVSGSMEGKDPSLLVVAEIRKPGLKKFLEETITQLPGASKPGVRIMDLQELSTATDKTSPKDLLVLIRPDFVVASLNLAVLRSFNARLDRHIREFVATPFGQRVVNEYKGGVTLLAAADLHKILDQVPSETRQNATFQRSGFADVKYLVWEHKSVTGRDVSQTELSFNAPRYGSASWLGKSSPLTNLDFVSPKAIVAGTLVLANPAQIFDDLKQFASTSNSNPFPGLAAMEQVLKLSLKDDLLNTLGGEVTVELDDVSPPQPVWKAILSVRDTGHLQQTFNTLLAVTRIQAQHFDEEGVTYSTFQVPNSKPAMEIGYAFVDGHLILASGRDAVSEAVRQHKTGASLGKSKTFLASLPPGTSLEASALLYQDPMAMTALRLRQLAPEVAESLRRVSKGATPGVVCLYADDNTIREASSGGSFDVGAALVVAAIAIPNLLRSRVAANEASAVGSVRTVNTSEVVYGSTYSKRGFAPDLATLGRDPHGPASGSQEHAGLLNEPLANASCTGDAWCTKSGYRFRITAVCKQHMCNEYVVVAAPADLNTGTRNFCSTSDGLIRSKPGSPLTAPVSVAECRAWPPLQ